MNIIIKILLGTTVLLGTYACNSNKKVENQENRENRDPSKMNRVGTLDTTKLVNVTPGDVASTDAYVEFIRSTLRSYKMRNGNQNGSSFTYLIGGKGDQKIRTVEEIMSANGKEKREFIHNQNRLIFIEETMSQTTPTPKNTMTRYYVADGKIVKVFKAETSGESDAKAREDGKGAIDFKEVAVSEGNPAIINGETNLINAFSKISSYEGRINKKGDKFVFTGCFDNKEYMLNDDKNLVGKLFTEERVAEGSYLYVDINGTLSSDGSTITVVTSNKQSAKGGKFDCYK